MGIVHQRTLGNGLRVVAERVAGSPSASMNITLLSGSRHEPLELNGATHFLEHLLFKGTARRDVYAIAREMNLLGGYLDAATSTDTLRLSNRAILADLPRALALFDEMLWESAFPEDEVERERGVILEEIAEYNDAPEEVAFDQFLAQLWLPDPLGRPILGDPDTIDRLGRADLVAWWERIRQPGAMVLSLAGGFDAEEALDAAEAAFRRRAGSPGQPPRCEPAKPSHGVSTIERDLEQVQFCLGYPAIGSRDDRRYALEALDTILGASQGSRLFNEIRERHGLAYTIGSAADWLQDEGYLMVYGATTAANIDKVLEKVDEQIRLLVSEGPTAEEMETTAIQHEREYLLALENNGFRAARNAAAVINGQPFPTDEEVLARIRGVRGDEVAELARAIFADAEPAVSLVGPVGKRQDFRATA